MKFGTAGTGDGTSKVTFFNTPRQEKPLTRRLSAFVFYKWWFVGHL
jgi:hypothetical protein